MQSSNSSRLASLALLAAAGMGFSAGTVAISDKPGRIDQASAIQQAASKSPLSRGIDTVRSGLQAAMLRGMFSGGPSRPSYPRPGHSVRQGQRLARKARNVRRNRRAHR